MVNINKFLFMFIVLTVFFITSCEKNQSVICNNPYILVGTECCLDKDENSICDRDEIEEDASNGMVCNEPYIRVGAICCLDKDNNAICDYDEKEEIEEDASEEKPDYTIADIQKDINKIPSGYFEEVLFKKTNLSINDYDFYTDGKKTTVFLIRRGTKEFFNVLEKPSLNLIIIKTEERHINDADDFLNFIRNQTRTLVNYLEIRKNSTILEMKNGTVSDYLSDKSEFKFEMINYTLTSAIMYDNISRIDDVSEKIAEIIKLSFEKYDAWYNNSKGKLINVEFIGLEYLQAYSVYCNPNLIITIYGKGYKEPNGYSGSFNEDSFKNLVVNERKKMLIEAQAVVDMCEHKYKNPISI